MKGGRRRWAGRQRRWARRGCSGPRPAAHLSAVRSLHTAPAGRLPRTPPNDSPRPPLCCLSRPPTATGDGLDAWRRTGEPGRRWTGEVKARGGFGCVSGQQAAGSGGGNAAICGEGDSRNGQAWGAGGAWGRPAGGGDRWQCSRGAEVSSGCVQPSTDGWHHPFELQSFHWCRTTYQATCPIRLVRTQPRPPWCSAVEALPASGWRSLPGTVTVGIHLGVVLDAPMPRCLLLCSRCGAGSMAAFPGICTVQGKLGLTQHCCGTEGKMPTSESVGPHDTMDMLDTPAAGGPPLCAMPRAATPRHPRAGAGVPEGRGAPAVQAHEAGAPQRGAQATAARVR